MTEHLLKAGFTNIDDNYHLARIQEFFEDSLVIYLQDTAVGLIKLSKLEKRLHIRQLQILPEYQNQGVGAKVITAVIKKAQLLQLPITLNVLINNPAKHLYQRHGFKIIGKTDLEYLMRYQF